MATPDWTSLPSDVVQIISRKLEVLIDYVRFRDVCRSWRYCTPKVSIDFPEQLPWLMLPQSSVHSDGRRFFELHNKRELRHLNLPEACYPRRVCGSSQGWLAIVERSPRLFLINPLTRDIVNLPPLDKFPNVFNFVFSRVGSEYGIRTLENTRTTASLTEMRDNFIKKIVLSDNPSKGHFLAVAIIRRTGQLQLAYCERGQDSWKLIEESIGYAEDVIFYDGLIYGVNERGMIAECYVSADNPPAVDIIGSPYVSDRPGNRIYLVNAMGTLLLVARFLSYDVDVDEEQMQWSGRTNQFRVFRYDFNARDDTHWKLMDDLADMMLFLGENSSLAFTLSHMPGFRGNIICFANDFSDKGNSELFDNDEFGILRLENFRGDNDVGMFDLEVGRVRRLICRPEDLDVHVPLPSWSHPVWVTPSAFSWKQRM